MDPRLEIKLQDASPKCATCAYYGKHHDTPMASAADCAKHAVTVLNLSVCSDWHEYTELEAVSE